MGTSSRGTRLVADHGLPARRRPGRPCASTRGATCAASAPTICSSPSACCRPRPTTTRAATKVVTRLRAAGGSGEALRIQLVESKQEAKAIDAMQAERTDEYHELVESTRQFHDELAGERRRGRATYTELEESDADLARYQRWLAAIRARDYFDAPGATRPPPPSPRVRPRSPSSRATRCPPSSTSPPRRGTSTPRRRAARRLKPARPHQAHAGLGRGQRRRESDSATRPAAAIATPAAATPIVTRTARR